MSNMVTITVEAATAIKIIAGTDIAIGDVYSFEDGPLTVTVKSINLNEERDGFAGRALAPYAWVVWSDEVHESSMNLATIGAYLRLGAFVKVAA